MEITYEEASEFIKTIYRFELLDELDSIETLIDILDNNPEVVVEI